MTSQPGWDAAGLFEDSFLDAVKRLRGELLLEKQRGKLAVCGSLANSIGNLYYRNSKYQAALGWFCVATKFRPDYAYSFCMVGRLRKRLQLGEYEVYLQESVKLDPGLELRLLQLENWRAAS